jgi:hypothetical protein
MAMISSIAIGRVAQMVPRARYGGKTSRLADKNALE